MHIIIDEKLQNIECPVSNFVPITGGLVGRTRLTEFLRGTVALDPNLVEKLIAVLDEMIELKRTSSFAPNWQDAGNIREQLRCRREIKTAIEYDEDKIRELLQDEHGADS